MFQKRKLETIDGFQGYFEFLKPEFPSKVLYENEIYNSVAHAYMAAQTSDSILRRRIHKAPTHKDMLEVAGVVQPGEDWLVKRLEVMLLLTRDKFRRNKDLRERLLATNSKLLVNSLLVTGSTQKELEERLYWG